MSHRAIQPGRRIITSTVALIVIVGAGVLNAEVLRFDSARDWAQWQLPLGGLEVSPTGGLEPVALRKQINAALNAAEFGGGARGASSNATTAALVIDGDRFTGWRPAATDPEGSAFIEIDLGRSVSAHAVTLVFAEDAPPFELFEVLVSTGEPQLDLVDAPIGDRVVYRKKQRFKGNTRHEVTFELDPLQDPPIQYVRVEPLLVPPDAELVEVEVRSFGDNASLGLLERGGSVDVVIGLGRANVVAALGNARALFDGDMATRMRFGAIPGRGPEDIDAHIVLDLGAAYWVDHVRVVGEALQRRRFQFKDYWLMTSDGSLAPDGTLIWDRHFSGRGGDADNRRGFVDHHFPVLPVRLVRVLWKFWDGSCASALVGGGQRATTNACSAFGVTQELQVFGEGFPQELTLRSPTLDLGERRNFGPVKWQGSAPSGTRLEIRSRTGDEVVEVHVFRDKNGKEVTQKAWGKLIPSFRGPIDTLELAGADFSPWSTSYVSSGESFQSPSPRRYLELEVGLLTEESDTAPALEWLQLTHSPPLAREALGEVFPMQVRPGVAEEFSYFVRTDAASAGFDGLALEASVPVAFIDAYVAEELVDAEAEDTDNGFRVALPRRARGGELVELRFSSAVFLQGTRFEAFLEDSRSSDRQRVDPGDATEEVASNTNVVRLPVAEDLLANAGFSARVVTPNGDGVNDELRIAVDVVNVLNPRPLRLRVFDLAGRLVFEQERLTESGNQELRWEARETGGRIVAPGVYVAELELLGDAGGSNERRAVAVVY